MDPSERKKKAPPLPKFQEPKTKDLQMTEKVTDFLQQISKQALTQQYTEKSQTLPTGALANANITSKTKLNLAGINSKLNSIMSNKKIDMNKIVESSKKVSEHQQQPKVRRDIEIEYDPAYPNSYEQANHHYQEMFARLRRTRAYRKEEEEDERISKMIAEYEKSGVEIEEETVEPISQANTLDDRESLALRMMQKQGFKIGEGLGKQSQGIRTPLTIKKLTDSSCRIEPSVFSLANFVTLEQSAQNALKAFKIEKSPIIALRINMGLPELTEEVQTQIREECGKYGEIKEWVALSSQEGIIFFCEYGTVEEAFRAFTRISGRYYDEKIINVFFYQRELFRQKNFTAPLHQSIQF